VTTTDRDAVSFGSLQKGTHEFVNEAIHIPSRKFSDVGTHLVQGWSRGSTLITFRPVFEFPFGQISLLARLLEVLFIGSLSEARSLI